VNESADLRTQRGTLEAQHAEAGTVTATAGGLLLDDTAFMVKEGRGALPRRG
jgi:hypothetical protein